MFLSESSRGQQSLLKLLLDQTSHIYTVILCPHSLNNDFNYEFYLKIQKKKQSE